jgi:hypothetical protein
MACAERGEGYSQGQNTQHYRHALCRLNIQVPAVDLRGVLDLARLRQLRVERLAMIAAAVAIATVRFDQITPVIGEHDGVIPAAV